MSVWRSLAGTVTAEVTSADIGQALTAIQNANIPVQDVTFVDELTVKLQLRRGDWRQLRSVCRRRGDSVKLLRRSGVYWALKGLLKRPVFVLGTLLLLAASMYLPTRVLFIRVEGNSAIPDRLILERAAQCGICFGTSRREVRSEKVKNALLEAMPQLQWAGVNTSGCVATISVRERAAEENEPEKGGVSSIVASQDGIIQALTVTSGSAACSVGQAVRAGQVLISGYTDCGLLIRSCRAEGEVYAQTERELTLIFPSQYHLRGQETGQIKKYALIIGKKRINFYKDSGISDTGCVKMYSENYVTLPGGFVLPIAIVTEEWTQYALSSEFIEPPELSGFAGTYLISLMRSGRILTRKETVTNEEGITILSGRYQCLEMIGTRRQEEIIEPNE